ncbi:MAG: hypothetical protein WCD37_18720 [Chloroflexia bacterium]
MNTVTPTPASAARPRLDRFLIAILIGLAALFLVAGLAAIFRQPPAELPADSPGGTVQRFYNAILQKDYDSAYLLLSDTMTDKPTQDEFAQHNASQASFNSAQQNGRVRIETDTIRDDTAVVTVSITQFYNDSSPFGGSNQYTSTETFTLRKENGGWRITEMPYNYIPYR